VRGVDFLGVTSQVEDFQATLARITWLWVHQTVRCSYFTEDFIGNQATIQAFLEVWMTCWGFGFEIYDLKQEFPTFS